MKKTLQINIGGYFFTIEEEAYQKLNTYLDALKRYFSTYESRDEIVQDIEARIAEKFYEKQQTSGIIENQDVEKIITSMGSVSDFEAVQDPEDLHQENHQEETFRREPSIVNGLYRDGKRKALGGVLSGIAHKYEFDVVWARIIYLVFTLGLIANNVGPVFIALYVIGWIVIPVKHNLEENPSVRKFYRNPEDKVIGGVASGLATFLRMDVKIMRIIFVVSGFFIIGIIIYLLFWIVAPVAHSVTQKLQLEGQPVTIQNIEKSVKIKESPQPEVRESTLSKIFLFPFRLIGIFFTFLGSLIRPLGTLFKFLAGFIIVMVGISIAFAALVSLGAIFGVLNSVDWISTGSLEFNQIIKEIPVLGVIFAFFAIFVPGIALIISGIMLMINKTLGNRNLWATLLLLWLTGIVGATAIGTKISMNFAKRETVAVNKSFSLPKDEVLIFDAKSPYNYSNEFRPGFNISSTSLSDLYLTSEFKANGPNSKEAKRFAENIDYSIEQHGSTLIFENKISVKEGDPFRDQSLRIHLEIPKGVKFKFTKRYLETFGFPYDFHVNAETDFSGENTFIYTEDNELKCLDCPETNPYDSIEDDFNYDSFSEKFDNWESTSFNKSLPTGGGFEKIKISRNFRVILVKGDSVSVKAYTDDENVLKEIKSNVNNKLLEIAYQDPFKEYDDRMYIYITTPHVSELSLEKGALLKMYGFDNSNSFGVKISENSRAAIHTNSKAMKLDIENRSNVLLQGDILQLFANVSGKSILKAQKAKIDLATIKASSSSVAEVSKVKNRNFTSEKDSKISEVE